MKKAQRVLGKWSDESSRPMHMEQRDPLSLENQGKKRTEFPLCEVVGETRKKKRTAFPPSEVVGFRGWGVPSKLLGFYKPRVAVPSPAPLVAPQKGATRVGGLGTLPRRFRRKQPPNPPPPARINRRRGLATLACSRGMKYLGLLPPTPPSSWPNRQEEGVDSLGPSKKKQGPARRRRGGGGNNSRVVVAAAAVE